MTCLRSLRMGTRPWIATGRQPPGFESGPRSLAAQLDEPPRLEPGPKPTLSNAIERKKENN